jgi:DNA-binding response OmpR family regulator
LPKTQCPCCGTEVERPFIVDLYTNAVVRGDRRVRLQPTQAVLLHTIAKKYPAGARMAELLVAVYGGIDGPANPMEATRVQICNVRKKIAPLGLGITNQFAVGYRFVVK